MTAYFFIQNCLGVIMTTTVLLHLVTHE